MTKAKPAEGKGKERIGRELVGWGVAMVPYADMGEILDA